LPKWDAKSPGQRAVIFLKHGLFSTLPVWKVYADHARRRARDLASFLVKD